MMPDHHHEPRDHTDTPDPRVKALSENDQRRLKRLHDDAVDGAMDERLRQTGGRQQ
jgi:hypothetical protein